MNARRAALGLGASLGDARATMAFATRAIESLPDTQVVATSRMYWSAPAGGVARCPFINAVVVVETTLSPGELVRACREIEARAGRRPSRRWADRVLDIDLLLVEGLVSRDPEATVPHPRLVDRPFALVPLVEAWPEAANPRTRRRYARLAAAQVPLAVAGALPRPFPEISRARDGATAMKFFLDTANLDEIREAASWGIIDGVTTNPSLIAKEGRDFVDTIYQICTIVDGPVSAETVAVDAPKMIEEGRLLARVHRNVVVKVPLTIEGIKCCKALSSEGIRVNVTLCFQPMQALIAAKAGATYISPFLGRLDDVSEDGMDLIQKIVQIYANYPELKTQVLSASIRHPLHMVQAAMAGSDVATAPFKVYKALYSHPLTDKGNAAFLKDWETVPDRDIIGQVNRWLASRG